MVYFTVLGIVKKMSIDYFEVVLSDDISANEGAAANIAESFSLDIKKANLLLSLAPGAITKPTIRAEAELIAERFRKAGLKVIIKRVDSENSPKFNRSSQHSNFHIGDRTIEAQNLPENISLGKRNLLTATTIEKPSRLTENKDLHRQRLLFSSLLSVLGLIALGLFLFFANSNSSGFSFGNPKLWQEYQLLIMGSAIGLIVGLPAFFYSLQKYRDSG